MNNILIILIGFVVVAAASGNIAKIFLKFKLPLITGFLFVGIISGPYVAGLITKESAHELLFLNDISLAFIAFAAGSELYLKELRGRFKSISWMTFGQLVVTFVLSSVVLFYIADYIPFMKEMDRNGKIAISILIGTIFVARSPASAIAIINELRAKGPFTQTAIGVTVIKDVLVIILFTICFSISGTLISGAEFKFTTIFILFIELIFSILMGVFGGRIIAFFMSFNLYDSLKTIIVLGIGWGIYGFAHFLSWLSMSRLGFSFYVEPLLISIVAGFYTINYTGHRQEFLKVIEDAGPLIYIMFFTLTGASISLDVLEHYWFIAIVLFSIRLITMIIGSFLGASAADESGLFMRIGWMPYVTQAGVGLGLVTVVAKAFPEWGVEFEAILIAVIVLNQFFGPPFFKWSITRMGESHAKAETQVFDGVHEALIFGLEDQSLSLAKTLQEHDWKVKIATMRDDIKRSRFQNYDIVNIKNYSLETFHQLEATKAEAIIAMQTDIENLKICEIAYEHCGTKDLIVRLHEHSNFEEFQKLGALIVEPSTSIVNLLFHFVRSPIATSILLGMEGHKDAVDVEVVNPVMQGLALRDLRLPTDVLVLSVKRGGNTVISHGYTRLRLGDQVTIVGSEESIKKVQLKFE
ncbi:MAG: cation:proton antiporter [Bacteroidota bacterium]